MLELVHWLPIISEFSSSRLGAYSKRAIIQDMRLFIKPIQDMDFQIFNLSQKIKNKQTTNRIVFANIFTYAKHFDVL